MLRHPCRSIVADGRRLFCGSVRRIAVQILTSGHGALLFPSCPRGDRRGDRRDRGQLFTLDILEIGVNSLHLTSYKKRTDYADYAVSRRPQDHRCVKKALPPVSPSLCSLCLWMCALPFWISTGNGATTRCVPVAAISSESVRPVSRNRRLTERRG